MSDALLATAPDQHACVHASAGTGKTWLLVTRLVRLLLAGAEPASILAVTFTRKAAAEMLQRLNERLALLANAEADDVDAYLRAMGCEPDSVLRARARRLYEDLLFAPRPPRATTFHAFCQEILQRFPVEAEVPPGFELLDSEAELIEAAWDALYAEATQSPNAPLACALDELFERCGGLSNTRSALQSLLDQRIDWWAFTQPAQDPVAYAAAAAQKLFQIDPSVDPVGDFFSPPRMVQFNDYADLLGRHAIKTHLDQVAILQAALDEPDLSARLQRLTPVLLTKGKPRARTANKALLKSLGSEACERLLELHSTLCADLLAVLDQQQRRANCRLNQVWYRAGQRLLEHYQRLKREQRVLDFADLEWRAYRLLNDAGQAHWVQYKLDARIDHFLIDEFQDTNPTQWRLLLPLLQELAAGATQRTRSVFLVGDAKQSIYGFRRADARLLDSASVWLEARLAARRYSLEASRRSAQAIIDCVNRAFIDSDLARLLPDFPLHSTHLQSLWGQVELLPPLTLEGAPVVPCAALRDPLQTPRPLPAEALHDREAERIAARIRALIDEQTLIGSGEDARPLRYSDILILMRSRTHAGSYERALRDAAIPYLGAARGTLLEALEIRDLEALLITLIAPHNDLALAQVLRSPLFAVSDTDLIQLAKTPGDHWMERLSTLASTGTASAALRRAATLLPAWRQWVGRLPVHDLLDRIYHEGDIQRRFEAAASAALRPRVRVNLTRFIELALEIDSGRYPSLPHFVNRLSSLRQRAADAPDDAPPESAGGDRVRFLTVHGAKGLEAPVVFLVDCGGGERDRNAWTARVEWPASRARPDYLILIGRKAERDAISRKLLDQQAAAERREDANLLYVALTRARQMLIVSAAVTEEQAERGWYGLLRQAWPAGAAGFVHSTGTAPAGHKTTPPPPAIEATVDARLQQSIQVPPRHLRIAPSRQTDHSDGPFYPLPAALSEPDARERGIAIHRLLEWLTQTPRRNRQQLLNGIARELQRDPQDGELLAWLNEAEAVVQNPALLSLFDGSAYTRAYTEVPIQYGDGDRLVDGVIDRLLVGPTTAHIIDYKSHQIDAEQCASLAESYRGQMQLYCEGVRRLWPQRRLRCSVLFTFPGVLFDLTA